MLWGVIALRIEQLSLGKNENALRHLRRLRYKPYEVLHIVLI